MQGGAGSSTSPGTLAGSGEPALAWLAAMRTARRTTLVVILLALASLLPVFAVRQPGVLLERGAGAVAVLAEFAMLALVGRNLLALKRARALLHEDSPPNALAVPRRAVGRSIAGLTLLGGVVFAHALAVQSSHLRRLVERCDAPGAGADTGADCAAAAALYEARDDMPRATELHANACERGIVQSCAWDGKRLDKTRAAFDASCREGDAAACRALAMVLYRTKETRTSPRARELLVRACSLGNALSCREVGTIAK